MGTNLITVKIEKTTYRRLQKYLDGIEHYNVSGGTSSLIDYAIEHDALGRKAARKEARKAERAERKAAKPPASAPAQEQEPPKDDDEWTHSEWMQELRRLYIKRADTLQGDELKQFCEACLPKFKVEDEARRLYEELKAEAEADDW